VLFAMWPLIQEHRKAGKKQHHGCRK
jgi:hypothetical protein